MSCDFICQEEYIFTSGGSSLKGTAPRSRACRAHCWRPDQAAVAVRQTHCSANVRTVARFLVPHFHVIPCHGRFVTCKSDRSGGGRSPSPRCPSLPAAAHSIPSLWRRGLGEDARWRRAPSSTPPSCQSAGSASTAGACPTTGSAKSTRFDSCRALKAGAWWQSVPDTARWLRRRW